jgi:LAO/AO transport system kinase
VDLIFMSSRRGPALVDIAGLIDGIRAGQRAVIARGITLIESRRSDHQRLARQLVQDLLPFTGGSILADKTRMPRLAVDAHAFVRPSPSSGTLGGVAAKTRECMLLLEAARYDIVLVETMGTGQAETVVADMTDVFMVLMLPGGGDELQGLKKGAVELADIIAVNKADGDNRHRAITAAAEYRAALHILTPRSPSWSPPVLTYSALTGEGVPQLWETVSAHDARMRASAERDARRREQQVKWMWAMLEERMLAHVHSDPALRTKLPTLEAAVAGGRMSAAVAVEEIAAALGI